MDGGPWARRQAAPCLLLTEWPEDQDLAMITVLSHTTALRQSQWKHPVPKPFLKEGAFQLQLLHSVPVTKLMRKLGELNAAEMKTIAEKLGARLQI